jgi:hypothetical protein
LRNVQHTIKTTNTRFTSLSFDLSKFGTANGTGARIEMSPCVAMLTRNSQTWTLSQIFIVVVADGVDFMNFGLDISSRMSTCSTISREPNNQEVIYLLDMSDDGLLITGLLPRWIRVRDLSLSLMLTPSVSGGDGIANR